MRPAKAVAVLAVLLSVAPCRASVADNRSATATGKQGATVGPSLWKLPTGMSVVLEEFGGVHATGRRDIHYHEGNKDGVDHEVHSDAWHGAGAAETRCGSR